MLLSLDVWCTRDAPWLQVQFPEFMGMETSYTRPIEPATDLRDAFRVFDRDGHGFITTAELRHAVTTLGERMTDEEADELISEADVSSEGHIDYEEFIKTISLPRERQDSSKRQDSFKSQNSS
ncbi:hypothetical protein HPB47_019200 [Ixodes persulcatus]|uniref:Uncharacterized protein n=1 Tax=Ixodes persulcatus TaxID=34615 RepID=A0AC60QIT6_IXOPE|nr:hypothetical protein HPB47_019200 [Ixodes persulcatus]